MDGRRGYLWMLLGMCLWGAAFGDEFFPKRCIAQTDYQKIPQGVEIEFICTAENECFPTDKTMQVLSRYMKNDALAHIRQCRRKRLTASISTGFVTYYHLNTKGILEG